MTAASEKTTIRLAAEDESRWGDSIECAAKMLRLGKLVAFPTETVYGLGADARSSGAVQGIFAAKGRPSHNPLIVHVADTAQARQWTSAWDSRAETLARAFWPGPLTLVLPCAPGIATEVTAGGATVGLRVPAHPVALALIRSAGMPIAAPSANRSNRISPTSAEAVLRTLDRRIDAVLDGGSCPVGIESTVLDLSGRRAAILRPGMVTSEEIRSALNQEVLHAASADEGALRSPGMMSRHYAPAIPLELVDLFAEDTPDAFLIRLGRDLQHAPHELILPDNPEGYAAHLYWALHIAETSGFSRIVLEKPPEGNRWRAIHDRLRRAAKG